MPRKARVQASTNVYHAIYCEESTNTDIRGWRRLHTLPWHPASTDRLQRGPGNRRGKATNDNDTSSCVSEPDPWGTLYKTYLDDGEYEEYPEYKCAPLWHTDRCGSRSESCTCPSDPSCSVSGQWECREVCAWNFRITVPYAICNFGVKLQLLHQKRAKIKTNCIFSVQRSFWTHFFACNRYFAYAMVLPIIRQS